VSHETSEHSLCVAKIVAELAAAIRVHEGVDAIHTAGESLVREACDALGGGVTRRGVIGS